MPALGRTELINEALRLMLVLGSGQSAEAEDAARVDARIDPLLAELTARDIVTIADDQDIDPALFGALADLLANEAAPAFGQPRDPAVKERAEDRLKVMARSTPMRLLGTESMLRRR